jgi:hypothetical protein
MEIGLYGKLTRKSTKKTIRQFSIQLRDASGISIQNADILPDLSLTGHNCS